MVASFSLSIMKSVEFEFDNELNMTYKLVALVQVDIRDRLCSANRALIVFMSGAISNNFYRIN